MHLLIPFASACSEGCAQTVRTLTLPTLQALLGRLTPLPPTEGDEDSLTPPHERELASALGLPLTDGLIPWAAHAVGDSTSAWAFVSPCHWQIGAQHIAMHPGPLPAFEAAASQALLQAMQPYFAEDGIELRYEQTHRWLARGEVFRHLATASLDRVAGRRVDAWMPQTGAASLRRLQSEMQMLFYTHPVNEAREQQGLLPVNAFWLHGSGALPGSPDATTPATTPAATPAATPHTACPGGLPQVADALRLPALAEDWAGWARAWQALDAGPLAALRAELDAGRAVRLTLCGERRARCWVTRPRPVWHRLLSQIRPKPLSSLIEML